MSKTAKILAIIGAVLLVVFGLLLFRGLKIEIADNKLTAQQETSTKINYLQNQISDLQNQIDANYASLTVRLTRQEVALVNKYCELLDKLQKLPKNITSERIALEQHLRACNVLILNKSIDALGSGVVLKYKDKFYILSAGHMAQNNKDEIYVGKNSLPLFQLEIVKHDYTMDDSLTDRENSRKNDLILFRVKHFNIKFDNYVELADEKPIEGDQIYIVGNPMGFENILSDGRVFKYIGNFMYYIDHTYFGNSGGGTYNRDGKLVGIVSHMIPLSADRSIPPYMIHGAVNIDTIKAFLKDVK